MIFNTIIVKIIVRQIKVIIFATQQMNTYTLLINFVRVNPTLKNTQKLNIVTTHSSTTIISYIYAQCKIKFQCKVKCPQVFLIINYISL